MYQVSEVCRRLENIFFGSHTQTHSVVVNFSLFIFGEKFFFLCCSLKNGEKWVGMCPIWKKQNNIEDNKIEKV